MTKLLMKQQAPRQRLVKLQHAIDTIGKADRKCICIAHHLSLFLWAAIVYIFREARRGAEVDVQVAPHRLPRTNQPPRVSPGYDVTIFHFARSLSIEAKLTSWGCWAAKAKEAKRLSPAAAAARTSKW
ncbi:hypothetical protein CCM_08385 [Cordyceps militaris CM01]|uniref:Uncharacterized protein n=1 Tax=Cordyceps militaris (strain CM01) TaxID=983644 RepID=G3JR46_CORMM|nr:uncharacterized protein CCM_08385 [Cordyceps militaris CM01]EGX88342.1 hypothetical protein CCM_08385 [Cordyceps militaris CM01]